MYIKRIILKNIKGFKELDFNLARTKTGNYEGWSVFTGDNGSGKSSLLKAIAVALIGKDASRSLQPSFERWIRFEEKEGIIEIDLVRDDPDDTFTSQGNTPDQGFIVGCSFLKNGGKEPLIKAISKVRSKPTHLGERGPWSTESHGWFSCGYGPFRRVFGASSDAQRLMSSSVTNRFVTMFREDASLAEVDVWLRELHHKVLEKKSEENSILESVLNLLRDEFMPNKIDLEGVDSDGVWLKDRQGLRLSWVDMSDGYRAALALMADILRHLLVAYGPANLFAKNPDGKLIINKSGVVLIDEIDAHLHPEWQREIGFWLKKHFPKIQFIVTSHSPIICQAADEKGLFHLPEPGSEEKPFQLSDADYKKIIASKPDKILLSPSFGLENSRSPRAVIARARYSALASKKKSVGKLTPEENKEAEQLKLFAIDDET
jgi:predicted ATP-binding protein involved in virulence